MAKHKLARPSLCWVTSKSLVPHTPRMSLSLSQPISYIVIGLLPLTLEDLLAQSGKVREASGTIVSVTANLVRVSLSNEVVDLLREEVLSQSLVTLGSHSFFSGVNWFYSRSIHWCHCH